MRSLVAALVMLVVALAPAALPAAERTVAIGDIHGAYDELFDILQTAGLIDAQGDWAGGGSLLVQTGDFTDRGSRVRESIELLMKIQRQAPAQGGEVRILLGNHEVMNLILSDRDARVNPDIHASFADARSEERRKAAFKDWKKWRVKRQRTQELILGEREFELSPELAAFLGQGEEEWLASHPLGLIEYFEALSADGEFGKWMRGLPVVTRVGDTLFLHGGIGPAYLDRTLEEINELHWRHLRDWTEDRKRLEKRRIVLPYFSFPETRLALEHQLYFPESVDDRELAIQAWDNLNALLEDLFGEASPLWYRGYAQPPLGLDDEALAALLDQTDAAYSVRRTVAAHSPIANHTILSRLDGRLFLIDTGMLSSYYGGRPSALEISATGVSAVYPATASEEESLGTNGQDQASDQSAPRPAPEVTERIFYGANGEPLPFQNRAAIERFLRQAAVVSVEPVGQGKTGAEKLLLELGGVRAHAIFHTIDDVRGGPTRPVTLNDGTRMMYFRDSYKGQVAVYELSKLLDMDNVPPAVVRKVYRRQGSVALWIENGTNLFGWRERGEGDPKDPDLYQQMHDMRVFDNLIDNTDRNSQNIFWSGDFQVWLIDHTRTLSQSKRLGNPDRVSKCSRALYERLKQLELDEVQEALGSYISTFEVRALMSRRDKVLELLEERIRKQGEDAVLFDYGEGPAISFSDVEEQA